MHIVTGAAGFIGSNLIAQMEEKGYKKIVGCDFLGETNKWKNIAKHDFYDFICPDSLFSYLNSNRNQIEVILHLGAISNTDATDGDQVLKTNYTLPRDLFHWCLLHRVRFIYASSAATYGDGENGFMDLEDDAYLSKLRPKNLYGWSKHAFDQSLKQMISDKESPHPLQCVGLKFFNVYGPNEYHKGSQSSVIPFFLKQIQETKSAQLFKSYKSDIPDGHQKRDFIFVDDVINVMIWFCENQEVSGLFNVGTGKAQTFLSIAKTIFKTLDINESIKYIEMPERLRNHYQYFTEASMEKLRKVGYLKEFTSIEDGVKKYLLDYLLKEDPYR